MINMKIKKDKLFSNITEKEKAKAVEKIIDSSCPRKSFFILTTAAAIICTLGIMNNNAAVIIGAMLVAPMLSPILAIALGISMGDFKLIYRSLNVTFKAFLYSLGFSFLIVLMLDEPEVLNHEMQLRSAVSLELVIIALIGGIAASLAITKKELHQYLTGTVIAVALIPAISMSAIALAMFDIQLFYNALIIFVLNLIGIILSSLLIFSLTRFYTSQDKARAELKEEAQILSKPDNKKASK